MLHTKHQGTILTAQINNYRGIKCFEKRIGLTVQNRAEAKHRLKLSKLAEKIEKALIAYQEELYNIGNTVTGKETAQ